MEAVLSGARKAGVGVIASFHDFQKTPPASRLVKRVSPTQKREKGQSHTMTYFEISAWLFPWRGH
jgi:3-dehydroquinate dehydratase